MNKYGRHLVNHVYVNVVNVDCVEKHARLIFKTMCHVILWPFSIAKTVSEHFLDSHISYLNSLSSCKRGMNYKKHKRDLHQTTTQPSTQM